MSVWYDIYKFWMNLWFAERILAENFSWQQEPKSEPVDPLAHHFWCTFMTVCSRTCDALVTAVIHSLYPSYPGPRGSTTHSSWSLVTLVLANMTDDFFPFESNFLHRWCVIISDLHATDLNAFTIDSQLPFTTCSPACPQTHLMALWTLLTAFLLISYLLSGWHFTFFQITI